MASPFRNALDFLGEIGIYDVVLPFLLIFGVVFAILEKTKVFGVEEIGGRKYTRKNVNAVVALVFAFFIVASAHFVEMITTVSSYTVILLFFPILFMVLIGSFMKEGEGGYLTGGWKVFFMIIMFVGFVLILLSAIKTGSGESWLSIAGGWTSGAKIGTGVGAIIMLIIIILLIAYTVKSPHPVEKK